MSSKESSTPTEEPTYTVEYLSDRLEQHGVPVFTQFEFFRIIQRMYQDAKNRGIRLYRGMTTKNDYTRLYSILEKNRVIRVDHDYGRRIIRILTVPDRSAEEIICLIDPTIYVSHLSAMQRWGLTDRRPRALMLTRPIRAMAKTQLDESEENPFTPTIISHPDRVRRQLIRVHETKSAGDYIQSRDVCMRVSTIGQTFHDMLQSPNLCGGMSHVLNVWEEHAETYLDEIVQSVDTTTTSLVKSRAGHIIEERLRLSHPGIEPWKALSQPGGSRRLDPSREFAADRSETWMISLNA